MNPNKWYDSLQEPWRMLLMIAAVLAILLIFNFVNPFLGSILLIGLILARMYYFYDHPHHYYENPYKDTPELVGKCCENGTFETPLNCQKGQPVGGSETTEIERLRYVE
jgi:hypothetical protein